KCLEESSINRIQDARTGLSLNVPMLFQPRQWNEGLLRYKKSHIIGIYVNCQNKNSVLSGMKLKQELNLSHVAFYGFSEFNHVLCQYSLDTLMERHHLTSDFTTSISSFFGKKTPNTTNSTANMFSNQP
ncbi:MAG TPA: hypothetical protein VHD33_02465, partial [Legionellaceae bacterium]|nr:hypothetical protein [Legionellaceae bacterium]